MNDIAPGLIYVVATPIGNLGDMTPRAVAILQSVNLILAEDTRHSTKLLEHFNINTPITAFHEHNEQEQASTILQRVLQGISVALISDAGTPLISDPGYRLIVGAKEQGIKVIPIPGPCAAIVALSAAGLPSDRFVFEGFLPVKENARKQRLQELESEERTLIFYESPHRIMSTLQAMQEVFTDDREIVLAKELTKLFETFHKSNISELLAWLEADPKRQKGEFVLLIHGKKKVVDETISVSVDQLLTTLLAELPLKQAVSLCVVLTKQSKNIIYARALELKKPRGSLKGIDTEIERDED